MIRTFLNQQIAPGKNEPTVVKYLCLIKEECENVHDSCHKCLEKVLN